MSPPTTVHLHPFECSESRFGVDYLEDTFSYFMPHTIIILSGSVPGKCLLVGMQALDVWSPVLHPLFNPCLIKW